MLLLLLAAAFGWGALHALSPGHGKAMVAAYLIGTRGTRRDAVLLGATVTVTHTIGVFALGLVTLGLSQYVLPEDLYPWLTLVSGLMVVVIGAGVLRSRLRRTHPHSHPHSHDHDHAHTHRGVLSMGAAAGLIPCPSALVVLLAAIAQHEVALGMLLIVAFSLGLAGTLTALGLAVVHARRFVPPHIAAGRLAALLPAASALLVIAVGFVLAAGLSPVLSDKRRTRNELRLPVSTGSRSSTTCSRASSTGAPLLVALWHRVPTRPPSRVGSRPPGRRDLAGGGRGRRHAQGGAPRRMVGRRPRRIAAARSACR